MDTDFPATMAFVEAARSRSFTEAGRRLGTSRSGVGKAIARLERGLGAKLLHRTTRRVALTPEGETFFERCRSILAELEDAQRAVVQGQEVPRGLLRVDAPVAYGRLVLLPRLAHLAERQPGIEIALTLGDPKVDLLERGVDAAVRIGDLPDSGMTARRIDRIAWVTCAGPSYLERFGAPERPEQLRDHNCLTYVESSTGKPAPWRFRDEGGGAVEVTVSGTLRADNGEALADAAACGLGIVQVHRYIAEAALARGELVPVLRGREAPGPPVHVVFPPDRHRAPRVRAFVDAVSSP